MAIFVVNAGASHILEANVDFQKKDRYHYFKEEIESTPVFFSGMLSGGRAMDIYSRERLAWDIENYFK